MDSRYDAAAYEEDFYAWTQQQAAALRAEAGLRSNAPVDWENVAEEIESMGNSQKNEISSRLRTICHHLLKWLYCPELRENCENDWRTTIRTQRDDLADELEGSKCLRAFAAEKFPQTYERGRKLAADGARVPLKTFPAEPPFTLEQALDPGFPAELFSRDEGA
jgi:hypothetical protein